MKETRKKLEAKKRMWRVKDRHGNVHKIKAVSKSHAMMKLMTRNTHD